MKITSGNSYEVNQCRKQISYQKPNQGNMAMRKDVSFGSAKNGVAKVLDFVNKRGFFAEFLIVDSLSMIIPRIWIGLNRDKEKTGHLNYQAGMEEAGREVVSGPSMFLIPMAIFEGLKHLSPGAKIQKDTLTELSSAMKDVVGETTDAKTLQNQEKLNKKLSEKLFDTAFDKFKIDNKQETKAKFVDLLNRPSAKSSEFKDLIIDINVKNKANPTLDSHAIKLSKYSINAEHLFKDYKHYSNDIINKFSKQNFAQSTMEKTKETAKTFLAEVQNKRLMTRMGASIASYLAVGSFLLVLPKLYIKNKISPAMQSAKRAQQETEGGVNENK